jgi:hypothetical protein
MAARFSKPEAQTRFSAHRGGGSNASSSYLAAGNTVPRLYGNRLSQSASSSLSRSASAAKSASSSAPASAFRAVLSFSGRFRNGGRTLPNCLMASRQVEVPARADCLLHNPALSEAPLRAVTSLAFGSWHPITRVYAIGQRPAPALCLITINRRSAQSTRTANLIPAPLQSTPPSRAPHSSAKRAARKGQEKRPLSLYRTISRRSSPSRPSPPGALRAALTAPARRERLTWISGKGGSGQACTFVHKEPRFVHTATSCI